MRKSFVSSSAAFASLCAVALTPACGAGAADGEMEDVSTQHARLSRLTNATSSANYTIAEQTAAPRLGASSVIGDEATDPITALDVNSPPFVDTALDPNEPVAQITPDFDGFAANHPWIGAKVGTPRLLTGGYSQEFEHATAYGTFASGAADVHEIHASIRTKYDFLANPDGFLLLGYPLTDETPTPDAVGRFNHFERGSIYFHPDNGAFEVHGAIRDCWAGLGWENSALGYPISDEMDMPGGVGRQSRFQHGIISWLPSGTFAAQTLPEDSPVPPTSTTAVFTMTGPVWVLRLDHRDVTRLDELLDDKKINSRGALGDLIYKIAKEKAPELLDQLKRGKDYVKTVDDLGGENGVEINGVVGTLGFIVNPRMNGAFAGIYNTLKQAARVTVAERTMADFILKAAASTPAMAEAFDMSVAAAVVREIANGTPFGMALVIGLGWAIDAFDTPPNPDDHGTVQADRTAIGPWESFTISQVGQGTDVAIQSWQGLFSAHDGGGSGVYANRPAVGDWETWTLIANGDGSISLRSRDGHFLKARNGGGSYCIADSTSIGPWEKFILVPLPDGKVALKTKSGNQYVSVQP